MSVIAPADPGPYLDRRIARLIEGPRSAAESPPYSTEETAAQELVVRLDRQGITATFEQDGDYWYCVFWGPRAGDGVKERVSSGSALTRPLAICRAVLNLPLSGSGKRLRLRIASRGWIGSGAPGPTASLERGKADDHPERPDRTHAPAAPDEAEQAGGSSEPVRAALKS
jgi:hypothetical protein